MLSGSEESRSDGEEGRGIVRIRGGLEEAKEA